jgi:hypothetical protein
MPEANLPVAVFGLSLSDWKVRTQEPENFDEEVKFLVSAWRPLHRLRSLFIRLFERKQVLRDGHYITSKDYRPRNSHCDNLAFISKCLWKWKKKARDPGYELAPASSSFLWAPAVTSRWSEDLLTNRLFFISG